MSGGQDPRQDLRAGLLRIAGQVTEDYRDLSRRPAQDPSRIRSQLRRSLGTVSVNVNVAQDAADRYEALYEPADHRFRALDDALRKARTKVLAAQLALDGERDEDEPCADRYLAESRLWFDAVDALKPVAFYCGAVAEHVAENPSPRLPGHGTGQETDP